MDPITTFSSPAVALPVENIDTDQIIPARFLTVTDKEGLGAGLFADWRYDAAGEPVPDFVLNRPGAQDARILVAGENFGCGSSREHAPWALVGYGFRAIVSTRFADIFQNNALKNGLLPVTVPPEIHARALEQIAATPDARFRIDLTTRTFHLPDGEEARFPVEAFALHCLLNGQDELRFLLDQEEAITRFEDAHPSGVSTQASPDSMSGAAGDARRSAPSASAPSASGPSASGLSASARSASARSARPVPGAGEGS